MSESRAPVVETRDRVHVVCDYMRKVRGERGKCRECPATVHDDSYGPGKLMCRGLAEEIMSIVIRGSPYPPQWKPPQPTIDPLTETV